MPTVTLASSSPQILTFVSTEAAFLAFFALVLLRTEAQATSQRAGGLVLLGAVTYAAEQRIVPICLTSGRPHWAAVLASLLWVQLLSASELLLASRVHAAQLPRPRARSAIALLFNVRRLGTPWQVKNVPSTAGLQTQTRTAFVVGRVAVTLLAYLSVDLMVSLPPADPALVRADKAALSSLRNLSVEDVIFRGAMTISYWFTTGVINLFMTNLGAVVGVLSATSRPVDCPPLYGSFLEAYNVRRFWGISWHQMFRSILTGHASLIVDNALPFLPHHSVASRYARLTVAFSISGLLHYRADQVQGVPDAENRALVFFLLHAAVIMLEDAVRPVLVALLPTRLRHTLGYLWVLAFFIWSSPIWMYPGARLGIDAAALLPVRLVGPWIARHFDTY
ncbi:hypothetical protein VPNG_08658 [Cytospora leucostoma]|uniref:Wax synthase domain-containing protein n=1 Tax=Cytospora leucostoma TaxID=1230097 RepID=A0A423W3C2_9PEZI|nr:hypothetical protein VPNG_08658 [Cytospora leucostoma]